MQSMPEIDIILAKKNTQYNLNTMLMEIYAHR